MRLDSSFSSQKSLDLGLFMKLPDEAIVKRCLEGDGNAFSLLVAKYQNAVYGLCYHIVGNFADAQDLTQEAFVKAYLDLARMRDPARFASWLYRIAVNTCKMWLRAQKRMDDLPLEAVAQSGEEFADSGSPAEHAETEELRLSIREAIASLSDKNRLVITLYYIDGLSYEEIGDFLSLPQSTIKGRLHKARKQLKEELISMVDNFDKHKLPEDFPEKVIQEVVVKNLNIDPKTKTPMLILQNKDDEEQLLPIWIGVSEGVAIAQRLDDKQTARPMTHDLMASVLKEFDMKVIKVVVTDLKESTFYARIAIESGGVLREIDARPSDSIALALRVGAPIFVAKSVLSESGVSPTGETPGKPLDLDALMKTQYSKVVTRTKDKPIHTSSLCNIDPKFQSDLDSNSISEELRQEFENNGIPLSSYATVSDNSWQITDKDNRHIIRKEGDKLTIYSVPKPPKKEGE